MVPLQSYWLLKDNTSGRDIIPQNAIKYLYSSKQSIIFAPHLVELVNINQIQYITHEYHA